MAKAIKCYQCGKILRENHLIYTLSSPVMYLHFHSLECLKEWLLDEGAE